MLMEKSCLDFISIHNKTMPVLTARNSKFTCETVAVVVQHHEQLSYVQHDKIAN